MKAYKLLTLFSIAGVYFFAFFQRIAVPGTVFNELQSTFMVSAAAVSALGAVYLYIYGGMQLFAGMLADKLGSAKMLIAGGAILSAGSIFFPMAASTGGLYLFRALIGLGASLIYISMLKHINVSFSSANFPLVLSVSIFLGYTGGLFATFPFERIVSRFGWQNSLAGAGIICTVVTVLMGYFLKGGFSYRGNSNSAAALKNVLKNRALRPVLCSGSANFSVYFLIQATIGQKMLQDFAGLSAPEASFFTFCMMFTTMLSVLLHGFIGKRTSRRKPFAMTAAVFTTAGTLLILLTLLHFQDSRLFLTAYLFCAFAGGNIINPTLVKELNPAESAGTAVGFYNGTMYSSVAVVSNLAGVAMDFYRDSAVVTEEAIIYPPAAYISIFSGCLLLGLFSLASSLRITEPR